jgi:hypothetical protein
VTPGLQLVERDWQAVTVEGLTLAGERASRDVRVCGPGAFIILKARAIRGRRKDKDAFDLYYVVRYYGAGLEDVVGALKPLLDADDAQEAVEWLRSDFSQHNSIGPMRAARFRYGQPDDAFQADVLGLVQRLLELIG